MNRIRAGGTFTDAFIRPRGPWMPAERLVGRDRASPEGGLPVVVRPRRLELGEDRREHRVEDVVLARDVVVQRHRLDAEACRELAHRQCRDSVGVGERQRLGDDDLAAQRPSNAAGVSDWRAP